MFSDSIAEATFSVGCSIAQRQILAVYQDSWPDPHNHEAVSPRETYIALSFSEHYLFRDVRIGRAPA